MSEWQPIETAPRKPLDEHGYGPTIFILVGNEPAVGFWDDDFSNFYFGDFSSPKRQPSHWLPVPQLPLTSAYREDSK